MTQFRRPYERAEEKKPCGTCNGTGKVPVVAQGKVIGREDCPACRGRGYK